MENKVHVVDFFSGCGGTSIGFQRAGMEIIAAIDNDKNAINSFKLNFPKSTIFSTDIQSLKPQELNIPLLNQRKGKLLFSGCAPCQPFSSQNKSKNYSFDERVNLLDEFWRFIHFFKPEFIFLENVPGLQKKANGGPLPRFLKNLHNSGYKYSIDIVSAADFGVPQKRKRLILVAALEKYIDMPTPTHGNQKLPYSVVKDWIYDFPHIKAGECDKKDQEHCAANLSEINLERISVTPSGGGREAWPERLKLQCHGDYKGHNDVYGRLSWTELAATLTTKCTSYSNGRFGHPEQNRAISLREAATLQTFPRQYKFSGSFQSKSRQIGNAVPPLLAEVFGKHIQRLAK